MRITTRIWSSLGILVAGYGLTVALTAHRSVGVDHFLTDLEAATVPNVNRAHAAFVSFKQMASSFQDAVVFAEPLSVARGEDAAREARAFLAEIVTSAPQDPLIPAKAREIDLQLGQLLEKSVPLYQQLAQGNTDRDLLPQANHSKNRLDNLSGQLIELERLAHTSVRNQIALRRQQNHEDRLFSQVALVIALIVTVALTSTILLSLSRRLQRLTDANARLQAGDYGAHIDDGGKDEIGQLSRGFAAMRSAIAARNDELQRFNATLDELVKQRTGELELRNQELSTQFQERQRVEHSLRLIESAIAQVEDGVMIVPNTPLHELSPAYVNAAFLRVLGLEAGELPSGLLVRALFTSAGKREHLERVWSSARDGQPQTIELIAESSDHRRLFSEWHVAPLREADGRIANLIIILRDTTERKQQEAQRQQGQKMESVGQLAAGIAHEINTPIQFIGDNLRFLADSFTDLGRVRAAYQGLFTAAAAGTVAAAHLTAVQNELKRADVDYLDEEIPKSIAQSQEGVVRVAEIVRAMKEFSHPDLGEKKATDLNKAIQTTLTVARNEYKYVADLVTDLDPALPPVPCIVGEFNQVILNLVVNAAHAIADVLERTGARGTITVRTAHDAGWAVVTVGDTGTGIPESARGKIFDPFFTTKAVGKGTGQGLYIAHTVIAKKHGGQLTFETEVGRGTTFRIRLPLRGN